MRAVHRVFEALARSNRIAYDPMEDIEDEFDWNWENEPTPLTAGQIRRLWETAETAAERMLVIGYCVWGVRTKELAGVHVDQIHLDPQDPHVAFEESQRKNGPGEVSLMFGINALGQLLDKRSNQPNWNGCLYPTDSDQRSFLSSDQMRERFKRLCEKAKVTIDGEVATPKHGRSFYFGILADAETDLLETATEIAKEQGSEDGETVRDRYLTPEKRRKYRRVFFRQRLRRIFPEDAHGEYRTPIDSEISIDEFL
jgi:integrase